MVSSIRFLTTSDTHGAWPYSPSDPAPKVDVLLHCGDLTLHDGRQFNVYASLYTPAFNRYAFAYQKEEDRFKIGENSAAAGVDIAMTHGPPLFPANPEYDLDVSQDGTHCGCEKLATAVHRAKPRLHCFGHLHEGRGAMLVRWTGEEEGQTGIPSMDRVQDNGATITVEKGTEGLGSLLVNAAMYGLGRGWEVDLVM